MLIVENQPGRVYTQPFPLNVDGSRWVADMTWAPVAGRVQCVGIELRSYPKPGDKLPFIPPDQPPAAVTAVLMRQIPWGSVIEQSRETITDLPDVWVDDEGRHLAERLAEQFKKAPSPRGRGPGHFADVAAVWREAWQYGNTPTRAVAERFHTSYSTAAHWVVRARKMGLLPPSTKGTPKIAKKAPKKKGRSR